MSAYHHCYSVCSYWHSHLTHFQPQGTSASILHFRYYTCMHERFCFYSQIPRFHITLPATVILWHTESHSSESELNMNVTSNFLFARLTDWLFLSLFIVLSAVSLAACLLTELPSISIHCYKVYLSICLCLSEFMAEWINDPLLWPHLFMSPCAFSFYLSPYAFQSLSSLQWYPSRFVCLCVHLDKEPSLLSRLATFHHLSSWSLSYKRFLPYFRSVQAIFREKRNVR